MDDPRLRPVRETLDALLAERMRPHEAAQRLRAQEELLAALPPRFGEVLHGLLDRLESSALFDGESCSFSQRDLHEHLSGWLTQAERRLASGA
ncbi:MAG: hypothetical protein IBJ14_16345 [Hydrogenophaga sp.]|nr:hypothetical protein [Hydrogenophaga sp.]